MMPKLGHRKLDFIIIIIIKNINENFFLAVFDLSKIRHQ